MAADDWTTEPYTKITRLKGKNFQLDFEAAIAFVIQNGGVLYGVFHTRDDAESTWYNLGVMIPTTERTRMLENISSITADFRIGMDSTMYYSRAWREFVVILKDQPFLNRARSKFWWI